MNKYEWVQCLSVAGGPGECPFTQENAIAVIAWSVKEGSNALWNPLDTEENEPGDRNYNSAGVKDYTNWLQGIAATWATLRNGLYAPVLAALRAGNSALNVEGAVANSPWGTGSFAAEVAAVRANPCRYYGELVAGSLPIP